MEKIKVMDIVYNMYKKTNDDIQKDDLTEIGVFKLRERLQTLDEIIITYKLGDKQQGKKNENDQNICKAL